MTIKDSVIEELKARVKALELANQLCEQKSRSMEEKLIAQKRA